MKSHGRCRFGGVCLFTAALLLGLNSAHAQSSSARPQLTRGFDLILAGNATGEELTAQPEFWALEVSFKPVRMIWADVTDPQTGKKQRELIWYLCYKATHRPPAQRNDDADMTPVNEEDPPPSPPLFVPEFLLMTEAKTGQRVYRDVVIPEAQAAILRREKRSAADPHYRNSVEAVGSIPEPALPGSPDEKAIYGVAMWRGIDLRTDNFTVFMTGFSNGYRVVQGPDGQPLVLRRTIVQDFWRPGDEFNPRENEIRREGDPRWVYRPDDPKLELDADTPEEAEPPQEDAADDPDV